MDPAERNEFLHIFFPAIYRRGEKVIVGIVVRPRLRAVLGACEGAARAVSTLEWAALNSAIGDPEGIQGRRKHIRQKIDPRLKRWGVTVVPVSTSPASALRTAARHRRSP